MKSNVIIYIIALFGLVSMVGIWNFRYNSAYDLSYVEGFNDGNQTGTSEGYSTGYEIGSQEGYNEGFETGKELGQVDGNLFGYQEGFSDGENEGYLSGYEHGEMRGLEYGYNIGIEAGSIGYPLRDPTYDEAVQFIENDDTNVLYGSTNYSNAYLLNNIKINAHHHGYRLLWVHVETVGSTGAFYFSAFNTTDNGLLVFSYEHDKFLELELWEPCFDREFWAEPPFDDRIAKIEFTP